MADSEWESMMSYMSQQMKQTTVAVQAFMVDISKRIDEMLKAAKIEAEKVAPYLSQANLWIPPSIPSLELLHRLKAAISVSEPTPEIITETFFKYFEEDQWNVLREIVGSWETHPYFKNRMPILRDALEAHIEGKYTLTVPTLLTQVEGVASSILKKTAGHTVDIMKNVVKNIDYGEFLQAALKDILIDFITSLAGYATIKPEYFTPEKFSELLKAKGQLESQVMNRHAILHGVQINYASKENSLRAFLLLDALFWIKREEWDEEFKWVIQGI